MSDTPDNFFHVSVSRADLLYSKFNNPIEYRCHWCSGAAFFVVARTSRLSGTKYSDYACTPCAQRWVTPTKTQKAAAHKTMWEQMLPGHREQHRERVAEARRAICDDLTLEQRRDMTAAARTKRRANIDSQKAGQ